MSETTDLLGDEAVGDSFAGILISLPTGNDTTD